MDDTLLLFVVTFFPAKFLLIFPALSAAWLTGLLLLIDLGVTTDDAGGLLPKWLVAAEVLHTMPWLVVAVVVCALQLAGVMTVVHCVLVTVTDDEKMIPEQDFTGAAMPEKNP